VRAPDNISPIGKHSIEDPNMIPDVSLGAKKWQLLPEDLRRVAILISGIVWPTSGTRHMKATFISNFDTAGNRQHQG
jgi:hypothetical protein